MQQIERDCFSVAKRRSIYIYIYTTLAFLALLGAPYIYDISSLRVNIPVVSRRVKNQSEHLRQSQKHILSSNVQE